MTDSRTNGELWRVVLQGLGDCAPADKASARRAISVLSERLTTLSANFEVQSDELDFYRRQFVEQNARASLELDAIIQRMERR